jgi:hypothetical protein
MNSSIQKKEKCTSTCLCILLALMVAISVPLTVHAGKSAQSSFSSPQEAVQALVEALRADNRQNLNAIFGKGAGDILSSGDPVQDKAGREEFLKAYDAKNVLVMEGEKKAILQVGTDDWPFPVPVVKKGKKWSFDAKKGRDELVNRRIGKNELATIQTCLAYVDAQREYTARDRDGDGLLEYAQKFVSSPGKKDGLYWDTKPGEEQSPFGELFARATKEGYQRADKPVPYHGYLFKILTAQGNNAPGGSLDYIVKGRMIGGFAMVAYPAQYGASGIMTFVVNHEGIVYQKNLGKNTAGAAAAMKTFNPDGSWKKVD